MSGEVTPGLRDLLSKQTCFVVENWGSDSKTGMSSADRETGDLVSAHVVSSKVRPAVDDNYEGPLTWDDLVSPERAPNLHIVVLDIDHPAHLVESSTPGHSHLYVEIPPASWTDYAAFLVAARKIGLIEEGYLNASLNRGHSDVRLPWIRKGDAGDLPTPGGIVETVAKPVEPTCTIASPLDCHQPVPTNREALEKLEMPF